MAQRHGRGESKFAGSDVARADIEVGIGGWLILAGKHIWPLVVAGIRVAQGEGAGPQCDSSAVLPLQVDRAR